MTPAGILRTIWSLCTPVATMSLGQFYTAMRYISLAQSGEMPISRDRLMSTMNQTFPLPVFSGIAVPPPPPQNVTPSPPTGGSSVPPFAITPEEHAKYHGLFLSYDKDGDGYITANEAVPIFAKSGLDNALLAVIWQMSDLDRDNRLTSKEFSLAFHLILCVGKRKLPCPSSLPPPLIAFVQNAPAVPVTPNPAPKPTAPVASQHTPPPTAQTTPASISQAVSNISSSTPSQTKPAATFSLPDPEHRATQNSTSSGSLEEQMELESTVRSISEVAKKSVSSQESSVSSLEKASSSLKYILQKLTAEKISLTSSLQNLEEDTAKANAHLEATLKEIAQLQVELEEIRGRVDLKRGNLNSVGTRLQSAESEKAQLLNAIADIRSQLDSGFEANRAASLKVKELTSEQSGFQSVLDSNAATSEQLQSDIQRGKSEIEMLREILFGLQNSKGLVDASNQSLMTQATALQRTSETLRNDVASSNAKIAALREQKAIVDKEKEQLTQNLASSSGVSSTPLQASSTIPNVASAPTLLGTSGAPHKSIVVEDVDDDEFNDGDTGARERTETFSAPKYENFGDDEDFPAPTQIDDSEEFPAPVAVENKSDDPFGSEPFHSTTEGAFDEFPAQKSDEAFGSFPPVNNESEKSHFEGFESDGFGDFASHTPKKPADKEGDSEFPPPSGDFAFGEFDSGFVEESFTAAHDSPW